VRLLNEKARRRSRAESFAESPAERETRV